ncbi:MAG TPA: isocitrate/isopropylmalate family dehydrogenase, partial [Candidatus Methanoperedens sp.]
NPIATIWAGALLLDQIGEKEASAHIVKSIEKNIVKGKVKTYDMGGSDTTSDVGDDIARLVRES